MNHGLYRGSRAVYWDIATALEKRFGVNILNWLGYPAWTNGRPSAWIRGLLQGLDKRTPTIVFLLLVGLFNSTVGAFEVSSTDESENIRLCGNTIVVSKWRANLPRLLANHSFGLTTVAHRIGVSQYIMASEARRQGIRVPLSNRVATRLGQEKLDSIRSDLRAGLPKKEIKKKHRANEWDILCIELDTPGIADARESAAAKKTRDAHRQRVLAMKASDPSASRRTLAKTSPRTHRYMLDLDRDWFEKTLPQRRRDSLANVPPLPGMDSVQPPNPSETGAVFSDWRTELPQLFATYSFGLAAAALQIGVSQERLAAEAQRQGIRVPLSNQVAMRLGQEKLESIRSDLRAGLPKKEVQKKHRAGQWTIRLIELDAPGIRDARESAAAKKIRDAHRQRVLAMKASDPSASRRTLVETSLGTYDYMLDQDREWFEKTLPQRRRGGLGPGTRAKRLDRGQLDSVLAEKVRDIISELKSTAHRPTRITKFGVLRRAGRLGKYITASTELPATEALLTEHAESKTDYLVRKIRWAVAEMATHGQAISIKGLRRKTGISSSRRLREHKQLVLETAQELAADVDPRSFFAQDT
jgi:hypothetical protein